MYKPRNSLVLAHILSLTKRVEGSDESRCVTTCTTNEKRERLTKRSQRGGYSKERSVYQRLSRGKEQLLRPSEQVEAVERAADDERAHARDPLCGMRHKIISYRAAHHRAKED